MSDNDIIGLINEKVIIDHIKLKDFKSLIND